VKLHHRKGMSLAEVLIGLAITASLLTAVAAAFQASASGITLNDQFTRASQAARVSVNQIMAQVRKCQSGVVGDTSLELTDDAGNVTTYAFDASTSKLTVTIDGITPVTHTMASNVQRVSFATDGKTISMTVTVKIGNNAVTLNGSAFPRRLMTYQ
jgi:prepilin-type N-terminal cleavage/methylation domain-containing protein